MRAPLERSQGSPFSVSTIDVALTSNRRVAAQEALVPLPEPEPAERPDGADEVHLATQPGTDTPRIASARAPPRLHPARSPDPTAPPIA